VHNYQKKISRMVESGELVFEPGGMSDIEISHDSWCAIHKGRLCDCDPDITVHPLPTVGAKAATA
jgi:hypothetical protein